MGWKSQGDSRLWWWRVSQHDLRRGWTRFGPSDSFAWHCFRGIWNPPSHVRLSRLGEKTYRENKSNFFTFSSYQIFIIIEFSHHTNNQNQTLKKNKNHKSCFRYSRENQFLVFCVHRTGNKNPSFSNNKIQHVADNEMQFLQNQVYCGYLVFKNSFLWFSLSSLFETLLSRVRRYGKKYSIAPS